jgi:hypothetical protein
MAQGQRREIEIYTAGCSTCNETVELVKRIAHSAHDIEVRRQNNTGSEARRAWSWTASSQAAAPGADRTR